MNSFAVTCCERAKPWLLCSDDLLLCRLSLLSAVYRGQSFPEYRIRTDVADLIHIASLRHDYCETVQRQAQREQPFYS